MSEVSVDSAPSIVIDVVDGAADKMQGGGIETSDFLDNGGEGNQNQSAELDSYPEG